MKDYKKFEDIVKQFPNHKIMVIGDAMLDKYLYCSVDRISPEAPVPIAKVESEKFVLGGAANVANNLIHLGMAVDFIGIVGDDMHGKTFLEGLEKSQIAVSHMVTSSHRPTIVKTRVVVGNHQLLRFDYEETKPIDIHIEHEILEKVRQNIQNVSIIILSDYGKGLLTQTLSQAIIKLASKRNVKVFVDPAMHPGTKYANAYLIKPNKKGAESIIHKKITHDYKNLEDIGWEIMKKLKPTVLLVTLGKEGMVIFEKGKDMVEVANATTREVYDVSGAGDTVIATFAACIGSGAEIHDAAVISNHAANIVISKLGTAYCTADELLHELQAS